MGAEARETPRTVAVSMDEECKLIGHGPAIRGNEVPALGGRPKQNLLIVETSSSASCALRTSIKILILACSTSSRRAGFLRLNVHFRRDDPEEIGSAKCSRLPWHVRDALKLEPELDGNGLARTRGMKPGVAQGRLNGIREHSGRRSSMRGCAECFHCASGRNFYRRGHRPGYPGLSR
jgi:hypothetical protein